jgi:hypothetical protein
MGAEVIRLLGCKIAGIANTRVVSSARILSISSIGTTGERPGWLMSERYKSYEIGKDVYKCAVKLA